MNTFKFSLFDHGPTKNDEIYDSKDPPEIDMTDNQNVPILIFYGESDKIVNPLDAQWTF